MKQKHVKLNQFYATAICGNDILSSALYVSGIAIIFAGVYAPLVLLVIGGVLFLYKSVYTEVVEALPVNGGAYNCLLNGTSKIVAAIAGITTFLSYIATAVISAKVAVEYSHTVITQIPVIPATIALLGLFALLIVSGLKDSAKVALAIFIFHILTLTTFLVIALYFFLQGHSHFFQNIGQTHILIKEKGGLITALYLAFSASLLGVSGFESSANFVEEQQGGVFRKTLRNMLIGVVIFNPLIALAVLNTLDFGAIAQAKDFLLADAAFQLGGKIFQYLVVTDAFLVLSGAVLTAYVGVSGLISRMSSDGCLPNYFSKINTKGSFPRIVISFFILCSTILIITKGQLLSLAGVYTIAFLSVMSLFAFGNLILRETRTELKRTYKAPLIFVLLALLATTFGVLGNIRIDQNNLHFFEIYFIPSVIVVFTVIYLDYILRFLLRITKRTGFIHEFIKRNFDDLVEGNFVAFIHNVDKVYHILDYINRNEVGRNIILVHCKCEEHKHEIEADRKKLSKILLHLKKAGVFPHLNVKLVFKDKPFAPKLIDEISKEMNVRKNRILIGSIHNFHPYNYSDLYGVRIIF